MKQTEEKSKGGRKRTHLVKVYLNDAEYEKLCKDAETFKRDKSKYLRLLIDWIEPVAPPSVEVKEFTRELRRLGVSMNQIAARANSLGFVDDLEYRRYADEVMKVYPNAGADAAASLQSVINDIAKDISSIKENKLDKVRLEEETLAKVYTALTNGEQGMTPLSGAPLPGAIPIYDENGELIVAVPTREGSAMNLGYFLNYMNEMASHIGAGVNFTMDKKTFIVTIEVLNRAGKVIHKTYLDLPLEEFVVGAAYESGKLTVTLKNGEKVEIPVSDIVGGLVTDAKHNADIKALDDKINLLFGEYVEEIDELVGGDYVDYSE